MLETLSEIEKYYGYLYNLSERELPRWPWQKSRLFKALLSNQETTASDSKSNLMPDKAVKGQLQLTLRESQHVIAAYQKKNKLLQGIDWLFNRHYIKQHLMLQDYYQYQQDLAKLSYKKSNPTYRYIAIRAPLKRGKGDDSLEDETCFTTSQAAEQAYKLSCLVSNRLEMAGGDLVNWHRARCGCSEAVHHYQKTGLSGGRLPSQYFGANVAWWLIMNLALNLEKIMQRLVANTKTKPQKSCLCHPYHLKKSRFCFICLPGHLVRHGRYLFLGLAPQCDWIKRILVNIRRQVHRLGQGPPRACLD